MGKFAIGLEKLVTMLYSRILFLREGETKQKYFKRVRCIEIETH